MTNHCIRYDPAANSNPVLELTLPASGATLSSQRPAQVRMRLFAKRFPAAPLTTLSGTTYLGAPRGHASRPWHLQLTSFTRGVSVCTP